MHKIVKFLSLNICYVIYVLLWIQYWLMWFEILLVFILFKCKKTSRHFQSWRTRSLCGPRANSSRWEQCTFLGISIWELLRPTSSPSTRKLYTPKWKLFTSWCGDRQLDPVNCPVGTVLEFLQARFSAGLTHSTLRSTWQPLWPTTPLLVASHWADTP